MSRLLREAGEALWGARWQTEAARALEVSDRTMRRWVAGDDSLPPGVALDLLRLCQERAMLLDAVSDKLKEASTPS
jgi:plasmid maintenance system antidote protein VapI